MWLLVANKMKTTSKEFRKFKEVIKNAVIEQENPEKLMQKKLLRDFFDQKNNLNTKKDDHTSKIAKKQVVLDMETI